MPKVKYHLYLHSSKESAYEAALDGLVGAGFSETEARMIVDKHPGLVYVGYEEKLNVEFDTDTGMVSTSLGNEEYFDARK